MGDRMLMLDGFLIVVCGFVGLEVLGRIVNRLGTRIGWDQIDGYIDKILRGGGDKGRMVFRAGGHQIEFFKRIDRGSRVTFQMLIRENARFPASIGDASRYLDSAGQPHAVCRTTIPPVRSWITVDIDLDVARAGRLTREIFFAVFKVLADAKLVVAFIGPVNVRAGAIVGWSPEDLAPTVCPHCSYDLSMSPDRCPECGRLVNDRDPRQAQDAPKR